MSAQMLFQSWFIGKQLSEDGNEIVRRQNEAEWQTSDRVWLKLRMENWWCVRMTTDVIRMELVGEKCLSVKWIRIRQLTDPAHNSQMSFADKGSNVGIMYGTGFEITSSYHKVSSGGRRKDRVSPKHHREPLLFIPTFRKPCIGFVSNHDFSLCESVLSHDPWIQGSLTLLLSF